jgi:antirestriction protein ArdC
MNRAYAGAGRADIYTRITNWILADLEQSVLPWHKPWNAEHAAGRISRPLRFNGAPYQGINVIILWQTAEACGYAAPIRMTLKQANQLGGVVRKGERAAPVVYTGRITRTGTDPGTGEQTEQGIPFLKSYTVFNVDQIDGLPDEFYARAQAPLISEQQRIQAVEEFFANTRIDIRYAGTRPITQSARTASPCRSSRPSSTPSPFTRPWPMRPHTPRDIPAVSTATSAVSDGEMKATPWKNSSPKSPRPISAPI